MGRPKGSGLKRFCVNGHDTYEVGRYQRSYACKACQAPHTRASRRRRGYAVRDDSTGSTSTPRRYIEL